MTGSVSKSVWVKLIPLFVVGQVVVGLFLLGVVVSSVNSVTGGTEAEVASAPAHRVDGRSPAAENVTSPSTVAPSTAAPSTVTPSTAAPPALRVTEVVDGDTVELSDGSKVRLIGIDTPERGQCGYGEASDVLRQLVGDRDVVLTTGASSDVDRYGRLLRYVDTSDGDVNLAMVTSGWAKARYDSRDGYGAHPREASYVAADAASPPRCEAAPAPAPAVKPAPAPANQPTRYRTCKEAKAAGEGPYYRGSVPYGWYRDADHDGVVCE